jgi:hypothetical protein
MAKITNVGVHIVESADAISDTAGEGQIWVDNQTPNQLKFTNDAGTDFGLSPSFISSEQTVTADTTLNVAHGLGAKPSSVVVTLICKTDDLGFVASTNDEIFYSCPTFGSADRGVTWFMDTTNVTLLQASSIPVINASATDSGNITVGNWRWIVRAWL